MSTADTLEIGGEPRPWLRRAAYAVGVMVVVALAFVSVHRFAERRAERASFDRMLSLAAASEAAVQHGVSDERDTARYAEPPLNSPQLASTVREQLYVAFYDSARQAQSDVDAQLQRVQADPTGRSGRLRGARDATITYLADWSDTFARAAGASGQYAGPQVDLDAARLAVKTALERAAPDRGRAAKASAIFATSSS